MSEVVFNFNEFSQISSACWTQMVVLQVVSFQGLRKQCIGIIFFPEKKLLIENTYYFFSQDIPRYQYCEKRQNKVEV